MIAHLIFQSSGIYCLLHDYTAANFHAQLATATITAIIITTITIIAIFQQTRAARLSDMESVARAISCFCNSCYKVFGVRLIFPDIWYLSARVSFCFIGRGTHKVEGNLHLCTEEAARHQTETAPHPACPLSALSPDILVWAAF